MDSTRKPFQGVTNIIRFNWHSYLGAASLVVLLWHKHIPWPRAPLLYSTIVCLVIAVAVIISLAVSYYVYDVSGLYSLDWLAEEIPPGGTVVNIHAGFDETSSLLKERFPAVELKVFDFYDPAKHTEISIKRARKAYPAYAGTTAISTGSVPLADASVDTVCVILSAHEIRDDEERAGFFRELKRVLKPSGRIVVTEHLRDLPNLLAYNIGGFHFLSKRTWEKTFDNAGLIIAREATITPFITTFILTHDGTAS